MSNSVIQICNKALALIGQSNINSLDENTPEAIQCKLRYESTRDELLREFPWSFTTGSIALALTKVTYPGWNYAYMYPSDAMVLQRVYDPKDPLNLTDKIQFTIRTDGQNKYILCNIPNLWADITYKITDPNLYDDQFSSVLSYKLAIQLVIPLTGMDARKNNLLQEYQMVLKSAQVVSAAESNFYPPLSTRYADARR